MQKIIWTITLILLGLGFMPYKFPSDPDNLADNEILVDHEESTCNADLFIVRGELAIPTDIKTYFQKNTTEFSIDEDGPSMFDPINDNFGNWWLVTENQFIISGRVTGIDSSYYKDCKVYYPKFKIDKWSPTKYHANFWSFSIPLFYPYFIALLAFPLTSIILFFVRRHRKSKT